MSAKEKMMKPRRLLLTGAAGFIGANFVYYWLSRHPQDELFLLDALTYAGNLQNLWPLKDRLNVRFYHGDIGDYALVESILKQQRIDTIVHFAAESHVDRSILSPDQFIEANIIGTYQLLKAAKAVWLDSDAAPLDHRFHHISTDEVFGTLAAADPALTENSPYAPNSPYAASKASADHLVRAYHQTYGLQVTSSNCSNNYGPYQFPEKLIPLMITNILRNKDLPVYGDGLQLRDWLYVEDHVQGIDLVLQRGKVGECYNIGGNNEWTNSEIVRLICNTINQRFEADPALIKKYPQAKYAAAGEAERLIKHVDDRPGHDRRYALNVAKAQHDLGYAPQQEFQTGIARTIDWYLQNNNWWQAILDGSYKSARL